MLIIVSKVLEGWSVIWVRSPTWCLNLVSSFLLPHQISLTFSILLWHNILVIIVKLRLIFLSLRSPISVFLEGLLKVKLVHF